MPVRILLVLLLVNFSTFAFSQSTPTQIRGPKSSDNAFIQQQFGPLTASDTLWRIAEQVKPNDSVTTYQVMYALFLKNPGAFNDANFNHLRPGAILILPDLREIRSVDAEQARRKAELDDQAWAERTRREAEARARAREQAAKPNQVQQQALTELNTLKDNYQSSMLLIEGIARENEQLRGSLGRLQQELEGLKAQLAEDSLLQTQLNQLLQQQQQILAEQEQRRLAELAAQQAPQSTLSQLMANPLTWALAASTPALLALLGLLFWIKRRSKKTEEVIAAATKEPVATAGYQSPVPPLDNSQDFDDSLFTLDDSLLDDAFEPAVTPGKSTPMGDDELPDFSDDILLDELDEHDPLQTDLLDDVQGDSFNLDDGLTTLDTAEASTAKAANELHFDADNILSDTDLASLLAADDEHEEVIELADTENIPEPELAEADSDLSLTDQDDIDNLLEEIELDWPEASSSEIEPAQEQLSNPLTLSPEPSKAPLEVASELEESRDALMDTTWDDELGLAASDDIKFDSSELEAFAEQLAAEESSPLLEDDLIQSEDEEMLQRELDDILVQAAEQNVSIDQANEFAVEPSQIPASDSEHQDSAGDTAEAELELDEFPLEPITGLTDVDIEQDTELEAETELNLDLAAAEDSSVIRPTEASLSVENPSQMLEEYPELDLSDFDPDDERQLEALSRQLEQLTTDPDEASSTDPITELTPEQFNLTDLENAQFEQLLTELEQVEPGVNADTDAESELLDNASSSLFDAEANGLQHEAISEQDFVEIDNLLSALEQPDNDDSRFEQLNVDVGLDEFADIIGEHTKMDVDQEDNGFAAKLDLVRAYIEMDEPESATLLIDEILTSAAPEHVKDEARQLRPE